MRLGAIDDMMDLKLRKLRQLARFCGVKLDYWSLQGKHEVASTESLLGVLKALGHSLSGPDEAAAMLARARLARWRVALPPVTVAWKGAPGRLRLRLPEEALGKTLQLAFELENGNCREAYARAADLSARPARPIEGERFVVCEWPLPSGLPMGYHQIALSWAGAEHRGHLIVAPARAWQPAPDSPDARAWGVFLPLYAMRSGRAWGAADWTDLGRLAEWTRAQGGRIVATLPMLSGMLGNGPRGDEPGPFEYSPYVPTSRLFLNELFVELEAIPDLAACPEALALLNSPATRQTMAELAEAGLVDYRRQMALKRRVLEALAERFFEDAPAERLAAFEGFRRDNPDVDDYARFRAATEHFGAPWHAWPEPARSGHPAVEDVDPRAFHYHLYAQWIAHEQLTALARRAREAGGGLYLDMPLGGAGDGYDAWRRQGLFAPSATGGAPPDAFFSKGQNWGFPPIHPERSRAEGHRYLIESIRRLARVAGALRIDHVMGLHRLYWIPNGMDATEGVYVHYPSEELYAILCLESARNRCRMIGENLGTVPPAVNAAMERHGMAGMHVLQFSVHPDGKAAIDPPPPGSIASLNTHDMPTFAAWWAGQDLNMQLEMGLLSPDQHAQERKRRDWTRDSMLYFLRRHGLLAENDASTGGVLAACLRWLARSRAELVLVNLEDLWLEKRPQNVPGTGPEERPNWRRRAALAFEDWTARPDCVKILAEIDALRRAS